MRGRCFACNKLTTDGRTCERCRRQTKLSGVTIGAYYDGTIKELIWKLKYHRSFSAAKVAAELILAAKPPLERIDLISSVPISASRYRERGYNQSELIARALAKRTGLPYRQLLDRATSDHQLGRGRSERLLGVQGVFLMHKTLHGEAILLIDDVITTGATLSECADVLHGAGAGRIWGAVVARH